MGCAPSTNAVTPTTAPSSSPSANDTVKPLRVEITTLPSSVEQQEQRQQQQQQHQQKRQDPLPHRMRSKASLLRLGPNGNGDDDDDIGREDGDDLMEKTMRDQMRQRDSGLSLGGERRSATNRGK